MAMADNRQRNMPLPDDRVPPRGQALAYPEAVLLVNPIEPELKGEVHFTLHSSMIEESLNCENIDTLI
jgi:hypothetical protein